MRHGFNWLTSTQAARIIGEPLFRLMGMRGAGVESELSQAKHVLVVRLDEIGDVMLTTPFLRELRGNLSEAWITLVVKPLVYNLVQLCPYVNEVLVYDWDTRGRFAQLQRHWRALRLAQRHLWFRRLDLAIIPRWGADWYHAVFLAYFSGARMRVGYSEGVAEDKRRMNHGYDRLLTRALSDANVAGKHEVERTLDVLRCLGGTVRDVSLEAWVGPEDEAFAAQLVADYALERGGPVIALGPGKRDPKRRWPLSNFAELSRHLARDYGARFIVLGEAAEAQLAETLQHELGQPVVNLVGRTTLRQAVAVLKRCMLYVGNDYGVKHLAASVGVPVVEINAHPICGSPTHPDSPNHFFPWGVPHCVLQPERPRPPCSSTCEAIDAHCIREITVEQAERAAIQHLQEAIDRRNEVFPARFKRARND